MFCAHSGFENEEYLSDLGFIRIKLAVFGVGQHCKESRQERLQYVVQVTVIVESTTRVKRKNGIGNIYGGFEFKVLTTNFIWE